MAAWIWLVTATAAQTAAMPPDQVVVVARADRYRLSAHALRAAEAAWANDRGRFAPFAPLRFVVEQRRGGSPVPPALRLTDGAHAIPLAAEADGSFALPPGAPRGWWLEADRDRGT